MTTVEDRELGTENAMPKARRTKVSLIWRALRTAPLSAWFGMIVIVTYLIVALFAPWLAPYGEAEIVPEPYAAVRRPVRGSAPTSSAATCYSRLDLRRPQHDRHRRSSPPSCPLPSAGSLGLLAAIYRRGWIDQLLSRAVDVLMSIPA